MAWYVSEITPLPFHHRRVELKDGATGAGMTLNAGEYTTERDIQLRFPPIAEQQSKRKKGKRENG